MSLAGCNALNGGGNGGGDETPAKQGTSTDKNAAVEQDDIFDWEKREPQNGNQNALKVQNSRLVRTAGEGAGVVGDVKNTGNQTFTFLQVQATLYDESDDVLGEFIDNSEQEAIDELQPGEVWDFEIWFENADLGNVASYSLSATGEVAGEGGANGGNGAGGGSNNSTA